LEYLLFHLFSIFQLSRAFDHVRLEEELVEMIVSGTEAKHGTTGKVTFNFLRRSGATLSFCRI